MVCMFKHFEIDFRSDDAIINIIRSEVKGRTKRSDFCIVEKFDSFKRTPDKERDALEIQNSTCKIVRIGVLKGVRMAFCNLY